MGGKGRINFRIDYVVKRHLFSPALVIRVYMAQIYSVRPKTPIFHEPAGRDQSELKIFVEEQQNLSKFDPEVFHEISPSIAGRDRFDMKSAQQRRFT